MLSAAAIESRPIEPQSTFLRDFPRQTCDVVAYVALERPPSTDACRSLQPCPSVLADTVKESLLITE